MEGGDFKEGFGTTLASGDFNGDGCDDLAVQLTKKKEEADARVEVLQGGSEHGIGSKPWRATERSAPGDEGPWTPRSSPRATGTATAAPNWPSSARGRGGSPTARTATRRPSRTSPARTARTASTARAAGLRL
ncbi:FG-GAP repeat protein [Streptomyces sp. M19]